MSRWRVILKKKPSNIIIEDFKTRKEAEEEVAWRIKLANHLKHTGYISNDPKSLYEIQKIKNVGNPKH